MSFLLRHVRYLPLYFLLIGIAGFLIYWTNFSQQAAILLLGPPMYLASMIKSVLANYIEDFKPSSAMLEFGFILPVTLVYFTGMGFQARQIMGERGFLRAITLVALIAFVVFIHVLAWYNLNGFFVPVE